MRSAYGAGRLYSDSVHPQETAADRLRLALELHDFGVALYRQRLRREHPEWASAQVDAAVGHWLADTPPHPGRPASMARMSRMSGGRRPPARDS